VAELGEPYGRLWQFLLDTYGPLDGARVLARVLGAINQQGAEVVGKALERALETGNSTPMVLIPLPVREVPATMTCGVNHHGQITLVLPFINAPCASNLVWTVCSETPQ